MRQAADTATLTPRYAYVAALTKEWRPTGTPETPRWTRAERMSRERGERDTLTSNDHLASDGEGGSEGVEKQSDGHSDLVRPSRRLGELGWIE